MDNYALTVMTIEELKREQLELKIRWGVLAEEHNEITNQIRYAKENHKVLINTLREKEKGYSDEIKACTKRLAEIEKLIKSTINN